jgi:hypothetical protein
MFMTSVFNPASSYFCLYRAVSFGGGRVKWAGREPNHSPPSSAGVKNEWNYIFIPPHCLYGVPPGPFSFTSRNRNVSRGIIMGKTAWLCVISTQSYGMLPPIKTGIAVQIPKHWKYSSYQESEYQTHCRHCSDISEAGNYSSVWKYLRDCSPCLFIFTDGLYGPFAILADLSRCSLHYLQFLHTWIQTALFSVS